MDFKNSRTYQNLLITYEKEAADSGTYEIYADKASVDGFMQISYIFEKAACYEKEHAKLFLMALHDGHLPHTYENLAQAQSEENKTWSKTLKEYEKIAREEGYEEIADLYEKIIRVAQHLDWMFLKLAKNIKEDHVFHKSQEVLWSCMNCGFVVYGKTAPEICPLCKHPQVFFEENCENF